MIKIKFRARPAWRESEHTYTGRAVLVALEPCAVLVRLKGKRAVYRVPFEQVFRAGAMLEARRIMAEKRAAKKARRKGE